MHVLYMIDDDDHSGPRSSHHAPRGRWAVMIHGEWRTARQAAEAGREGGRQVPAGQAGEGQATAVLLAHGDGRRSRGSSSSLPLPGRLTLSRRRAGPTHTTDDDDTLPQSIEKE